MVEPDQTCGVDGVIITSDLDRRPSRTPDYQAENQALTELAKTLASSPAMVLQCLAEVAMRMTRSGSAGISLLEPGGDQGTFRWVATAGAWAPYRNGTMPRRESPCGEVMARNAVLLVDRPERAFPALLQAQPGIGEGLLAPFAIDGIQVGTVWVVQHSEGEGFDAEDARLLNCLSHFAAAAYKVTAVHDAMLANEQQLRSSRDLLKATMDASTDMIQVFEAVRDAGGEIVDFRWILNNHTAVRQSGDVCGESLLERNPGVVEEQIFDAFRRVAETGVPDQAERHYVHEQFDGWFYQSVVKLNDGVATTTKDITGWKRAQDEILRLQEVVAATRLRETEQRFAAFVRASSEVVYQVNPDWTHMRQLDEHGLFVDTAAPGASWRDRYISARDRPEVDRAIDRAIATRSMFELEHRIRRTDGSLGWVLSRAVPILDADGEITEWLGASQDVTMRRRNEDALRDSETRFRLFSDASTDILWIRNAETMRMEFASPAYDAIYGTPGPGRGGESGLRSWARLIEPESRKTVLRNFRRVRNGERIEQEFRIRRATDGALRWIHNTDFPLRDAAGNVRWLAGVGADITDAKEFVDRQGVLVAELQHRTRNLIAVVRSLADRTLVNATSLDDFGERFRPRLAALSRVQGLLSHLATGERVTFRDLLGAELAAHGVGDGPLGKVTLDGPDHVPLRSTTVQTFALALHELATNAVKYGAFSVPDGHLTVRWKVEPAVGDDLPCLHVEWQESGVVVSDVSIAPRRRGYGRELIERALPYQLKAKTSYTLGADGVRCTIVVPISRATIEGNTEE